MRNELIRLVLLEGLNMKHTLDSRFYRIMTAKIVELFPGEKPVRKLFFYNCLTCAFTILCFRKRIIEQGILPLMATESRHVESS